MIDCYGLSGSFAGGFVGFRRKGSFGKHTQQQLARRRLQAAGNGLLAGLKGGQQPLSGAYVEKIRKTNKLQTNTQVEGSNGFAGLRGIDAWVWPATWTSKVDDTALGTVGSG